MGLVHLDLAFIHVPTQATLRIQRRSDDPSVRQIKLKAECARGSERDLEVRLTLLTIV